MGTILNIKKKVLPLVNTFILKFNRLDQNILLLKINIILLGILYLILCSFPKRDDFWRITYNSIIFIQDPLHFMNLNLQYIVYPPSIYAIEGYWLSLGSFLFHYNLDDLAKMIFTTYYNGFVDGSVPGNTLFPVWGMLPLLIALFFLVVICYMVLETKWLSILCFGPLTFVSIALFGQLDIFCILFIFVSLILMREALTSERYFLLIFLSFTLLGISMQFKTYGALLLPVYFLYTFSILKNRTLKKIESFIIVLISTLYFLLAMFIVWIPYGFAAFQSVILTGESNWLFSYQLSNGLSLWLLGYFFIFCFIGHYTIKNSSTFVNDRRYFDFFNFIVIIWFFISVFTYPQWWILLLPAIILVMDSFKIKNNYIYCVFVFTIFLIFIDSWVGTIISSFDAYFGPFISALGQLNPNEHVISAL